MSDLDPLMRRLADADPVSGQRQEEAGRSPSADRLLHQIVGRDHRTHGSGGGWSRRRRVLAVGTAIAVATAAGLVYLEGQRAPATASELLRETAEVAEEDEGLIGEGTYLYAKVKVDQLTISGEGGEAWSVVLPIEEETWVAADGAGRIRSVIGEPRFLGPRDRERWRAAGSPPFASGVSDDEFPAGTLVYEDLSSLPTVPDRLLAVLQDQVASEDLPSDVAVFVRVGELLANADATPELRAALYRVAAGLPGIELDGVTADPSGRPGVAVAMTYTQRGAAVRASMIFDAETSALLARVEVLLERATWVDAEPGTPFFSMTYLAGGRTDSLDS